MKRAIGIFDSGVGGLTVYKAIRQAFPAEDLIYFGDTARVPYGPKSRRTIIDYSVQNARFLIQQRVKSIVVACNTSSALALDALHSLTPLPIIGVIAPGSETAVESTRNGKIGVIGTEATVRSAAYDEAIKLLMPESEVYSKACPLFVPLVEEGWQDHPIAFEIAKTYLQELMDKGIDTLVLGCTHYPLLSQTISLVLGDEVKLVDSAEAIALHLGEILEQPESTEPGADHFYVSDSEEKFSALALRILQRDIQNLKRVKLFESWFID